MLAIETKGMFERLNRHMYWKKANCIIISMGGVPTRACRRFIRRLTSRRVCSECGADYNLYLNPPNADNICTVCGGKIIQRDDDQEATIKNRLEVYGKQTAPLINYYKNKGNFHQIKGDDPIDEIFDNILKVLKN